MTVTERAHTDDKAFPPETIAAARNGDRKALRELHERIHPYVGYVLLVLTHRSSGLEDLHAEICAEVLLSLPRYRGEAKFGTWIGAITARRLRHWRRSTFREQRTREEVFALGPPESPRPDEILIRRERLLHVSEEIVRLPEPLYTNVALVSVLGHTPAEVARLIGGTPRSVTNATYRARVWIRNVMASKGRLNEDPGPATTPGEDPNGQPTPVLAGEEAGPGGRSRR